ncbi:fibronectin type III domain-containing protein [Paenibacillus hodogayensis]|uniref:Fibronectin type III domain-containing protein n=1 Tax=Paenibacillus hodogayensis TaxID=279208 RepID=A0ABV5W3G9_9BACL
MVGGLVGVNVWKRKQPTSASPKSLVTTIKGDARTTRAFAWYSDSPQADAIVQVAKGAGNGSFEGSNVLVVKGTSRAIRTGGGREQGAHQVEVTGLSPGTTYTYRVGSGEGGAWSEPASFTTEEADASRFTFINVTDSQGETEGDFALWGATLDRAFATYPDARFIVHNGDLTENPQDEKAWDAFFRQARRYLTSIPLMPVTGNHDEEGGKADRFVSHFNVPDNGAEGSIPGTTYSFDYGTAHVVVLNTESNLKAQTKWLRDDLARTGKPWKIIALHRGPYGGNRNEKVEEWTSVFDEFAVDLVLQGHNHEYSRSYPLRGGSIAGDGVRPVRGREGTVYVVANTAGPKFNKKKEDLFYHKVHVQNGKQVFAAITIDGGTLTYRAYEADGNKLDEFVIVH